MIQKDTSLFIQQLSMIAGESFPTIGGDISLSPYLAALQILHGETDINKVISNSKVFVKQCRRDKPEEFQQFIDSKGYAGNTVSILCGFDASTKAPDLTDAWRKPDPHAGYMSGFAKCRIYINAEEKAIVAYVHGSLNPRWMHALMVFLPQFATWFEYPRTFPAESRDWGVELSAQATTQERCDEMLLDVFRRAGEKLDLGSMVASSVLHRYVNESRDKQLEAVRTEVSNEEDAAERLYSQLEERLIELERCKTRLAALELAPDASSEEMLRVFNSRGATILGYEDGKIKFGFCGLLEWFDPDEVQANIKRGSFDGRSVYKRQSQIRKDVFHAIFVEQRARLRVQATFTMTASRLIHSVPYGTYLPMNEWMPNPHIYNHGCDGANSAEYSRFAKSGDYDLALDQAKSATKNWNVGDSTVTGELLEWFFNHFDDRIVEMSNGDVITLNDLAKIITDEKTAAKRAAAAAARKAKKDETETPHE